MAVSEWHFDGHTVRLRHGSWFGAAEIAVDGNVVFKRGPVWSDPGFVSHFKIGETDAAVRVTSRGLGYRYEFLTNADAQRAAPPVVMDSRWRRMYLFLMPVVRRFATRFHTWFAAQHPAVAALLLLASVASLDHFRRYGFYIGDASCDCLHWTAIFVAGAVQRGRWRDVLWMTLVACCGCLIDRAIPWTDKLSFWSDVQPLVRRSAFLLLAASGESFLTTGRFPRSPGWLAVLALGAAAIHALVHDFAYYCKWTIRIPTEWWPDDVNGRDYGLGAIYWPLLAILTWSVIRVAVPLVTRTSRRQMALASWVTVCVLGYSAYKVIAVPRIAAFSLEHDFPFDRTSSVWLLHSSRFAGLSDFLWRRLENDEWKSIPSYWRNGEAVMTPDWNWRQVGIYVLSQKDREGTARRLCELLLRRPRERLAAEAAPLLGECRRYECAPLLYRYAIADSIDGFSPQLTEALVTMRVPQAAELILTNTMRSEYVVEQDALIDAILSVKKLPDRYGRSRDVSPEDRKRLMNLLHHDAGLKLADWVEFYDETIKTLETPLMPEQRLEIECTDECFDIYLRAESLWRRIESARLRRYVADRLGGDSSQDERQIRRFAEEARSKIEYGYANWDVPTAAELKQEMLAYLERGITAAREELGEDQERNGPDDNGK